MKPASPGAQFRNYFAVECVTTLGQKSNITISGIKQII